MSLPVSVCIPVRNEEANLPGCLASVSAFSEVIVVDSWSSDGTVRIAEQAGGEYCSLMGMESFQRSGLGLLRQHRFRHPWV